MISLRSASGTRTSHRPPTAKFGSYCSARKKNMPAIQSSISNAIRTGAYPLTGDVTDYDLLIDRIGEARFVLLGEASHGTHEFYHERAEITKRLIREKRFAAVAVEADWPDAYLINRYVRGAGPAED